MIDRVRASWSRPVGELQRRTLFALCAGLLVAVAVGASVLGRREGPDRLTERAARPVDLAVPTMASGDRAAAQRIDRRRPEAATPTGEVAEAERVARRFLRTYLPYTYGQVPATAVGTGATPELRRALAARPPRVPAAVRVLRPRVTALQTEALSVRRLEVLVFVSDRQRRYSFPLGLQAGAGGWRVSGLAGA